MEKKEMLSPEEMEKATGGATKTVTRDGAEVHIAASRKSPLVGQLMTGMPVNFTGTVSYNEEDGYTWYQISSPVSGWMMKRDIGV